jgi:hypothetical protein
MQNLLRPPERGIGVAPFFVIDSSSPLFGLG